MLRWSSDCVLSFLYSQILPYEIFFRTSLISPVRGLSDKKLRLGVDFWCDYYIMVEEWNYSEGSIFCQTYDENEKLRMKYDR